MSAFTKPLSQVREALKYQEDASLIGPLFPEALAALDRVERLATNMETALVAMVYVHPCNCGDGIPEEACARCRAVKLLSFDPAVLSAREEGADTR